MKTSKKKPKKNLREVLHILDIFDGKIEQKLIEQTLKEKCGNVDATITELSPLLAVHDTKKFADTSRFIHFMLENSELKRAEEDILAQIYEHSNYNFELAVSKIADCFPDAVNLANIFEQARCKDVDSNRVEVHQMKSSESLLQIEHLDTLYQHFPSSCRHKGDFVPAKELESLLIEHLIQISECPSGDFAHLKYEVAYAQVEEICGSGVDSATIQDALFENAFDVSAAVAYILNPDTRSREELLRLRPVTPLWTYASIAKKSSSSSLSSDADESNAMASSNGPKTGAATTPSLSPSPPGQPCSFHKPMKLKAPAIVVVDNSTPDMTRGPEQCRARAKEWQQMASDAYHSMVANFKQAAGAHRMREGGGCLARQLADKGQAAKQRMVYAAAMSAMYTLLSNNPSLRVRVDRCSGDLEYMGFAAAGSPPQGSQAHSPQSGDKRRMRQQTAGQGQQRGLGGARGGGSGTGADCLIVDLHGIRVAHALMLARSAIRFHDLANNSSSASSSMSSSLSLRVVGEATVEIRFVVGRGVHSENGVAKIKPALEALLLQMGVRHLVTEGEVVALPPPSK